MSLRPLIAACLCLAIYAAAPARAWTAADATASGAFSYDTGSASTFAAYTDSGFGSSDSDSPIFSNLTTGGSATATFSRVYTKQAGDGGYTATVTANGTARMTAYGGDGMMPGTGQGKGRIKIIPSPSDANTLVLLVSVNKSTAGAAVNDDQSDDRVWGFTLNDSGTVSMALEVSSYATSTNYGSATGYGYGTLDFSTP